VNVDVYDVFIIMTADRFSKQDEWLGKELQNRNKEVMLVRTKIGLDVDNFKHDHPEIDDNTVPRKVFEEVRTEMHVKLPKSSEIFLIDNHHSDMYGFSDLEKCITERLSGLKGQALVLSASCTSKDILERKVAELSKNIMHQAIYVAVFGTMPWMSAYTDEMVLRETALDYVKQLGLDVESLKKMSTHKVMLNDLKRKVDKVLEDIPNVMSRSGSVKWDGSFISGFRTVIARALPGVNTMKSTVTVSVSLKEILDRFESISREAIDACNE